MCGIVGSAEVCGSGPQPWLQVASNALYHRGPDEFGEWWSDCGRVGLAHRRLSIIDLSELGTQPMHSRSRFSSIVFNGEIYNFMELRSELSDLGHKFYSRSDTEVLLAAYEEWGTGCLEKLNGMFAFALFDSLRQKLFLARDRAGEKPLYYKKSSGSLRFASELKALLSDHSMPRKIDWEALDCYFSMGFVPGEQCIYEGYRKLAPGHAMTFNIVDDSLEIWRYWEPPAFSEENYTELELVDRLDEILEDAVRRQMVSDVPIGILLSGGLDSSLITAMAARNSDNVRTFSVGFPGHGKFDESKHARLIANHFGTEHIELIAEPTSVDLLPSLARQFDEPMVDSSMFPTWLVTNLIRKHCTVALGGDGGDELFGGYGHHSLLLKMRDTLKYIPKWVREIVAKSTERFAPYGIKGRNYLLGFDVDLNFGLPAVSSVCFDRVARTQLLRGYEQHKLIAETIRSERTSKDIDLLQRITRTDFSNFLAEDVLVKVDRTSMMNSLEVRAPILDRRVLDFAFGKVPSHLKATNTNKKILLKSLARRILPDDFNENRKQGFSIPISEWLKSGPFRALFWDTLTSSRCQLDQKIIRQLLEGQDKGRNNGERLFALLLFELWCREYRPSL